jgi:hypothetical protein
LCGRVRLLAAKQLGEKQVPVHIATGLTPGQIRAFRRMDNRSHQGYRAARSRDSRVAGVEHLRRADRFRSRRDFKVSRFGRFRLRNTTRVSRPNTSVRNVVTAGAANLIGDLRPRRCRTRQTDHGPASHATNGQHRSQGTLHCLRRRWLYPGIENGLDCCILFGENA